MIANPVSQIGESLHLETIAPSLGALWYAQVVMNPLVTKVGFWPAWLNCAGVDVVCEALQDTLSLRC